MKRLFIMIPFVFFACHKPQNLLDEPEYKAMVAHSWQSDSIYTKTNGTTTVSYWSAQNYQLLHFYFPHFGIISYKNGQIIDSVNYFLGYDPGRILFLASADTSSTVSVNYANIKLVTDNNLILERHTSADSTLPVVTTYYHAQ